MKIFQSKTDRLSTISTIIFNPSTPTRLLFCAKSAILNTKSIIFDQDFVGFSKEPRTHPQHLWPPTAAQPPAPISAQTYQIIVFSTKSIDLRTTLIVCSTESIGFSHEIPRENLPCCVLYYKINTFQQEIRIPERQITVLPLKTDLPTPSHLLVALQALYLSATIHPSF